VTAHTVQAAAPLSPGEYRMIGGLYDFETMQCALVVLPGQPPADHMELVHVGISQPPVRLPRPCPCKSI
jgi:hypothetical protein